MLLQSYVYGEWRSGEGQGVALRDATTGEAVAEATSAGLDFRAVLTHAREVGGPALRALFLTMVHRHPDVTTVSYARFAAGPWLL